MITTEAWVIHEGPGTDDAGPAELTLEHVEFPDPADDEVLIEPIFGSWEANMDHGVRRDPVDICRQRGDERVILGNAGVVRVLRPGPDVAGLREGDLCLFMPFGESDPCGYMKLVFGYDHPGSHGLLARRVPVPAELLVPLPENGAHAPLDWAASYLRYFTAWDNWQVAEACWRAQRQDDGHEPLVFGWGGGVVLAELELAKAKGFRVAMASGNRKRLDDIAARGMIPIDRRLFPDLSYTSGADADTKARYQRSERAFLDEIDRASGGRGAAIVLDNIGGGVYRATMKSLARQGVISTVGWKAGMRLWNMRATECIQRHLHVHTHAWRLSDAVRIRDHMEDNDWLAHVDADQIYPFDQVPALAQDYCSGALDSYFPTFAINPL